MPWRSHAESKVKLVGRPPAPSLRSPGAGDTFLSWPVWGALDAGPRVQAWRECGGQSLEASGSWAEPSGLTPCESHAPCQTYISLMRALSPDCKELWGRDWGQLGQSLRGLINKLCDLGCAPEPFRPPVSPSLRWGLPSLRWGSIENLKVPSCPRHSVFLDLQSVWGNGKVSVKLGADWVLTGC